MTTIYVVHGVSDGFAREDPCKSQVYGSYTDKDVARRHAMVMHGTVTPIELDIVPPGIQQSLRDLGLAETYFGS